MRDTLARSLFETAFSTVTGGGHGFGLRITRAAGAATVRICHGSPGIRTGFRSGVDGRASGPRGRHVRRHDAGPHPPRLARRLVPCPIESDRPRDVRRRTLPARRAGSGAFAVRQHGDVGIDRSARPGRTRLAARRKAALTVGPRPKAASWSARDTRRSEAAIPQTASRRRAMPLRRPRSERAGRIRSALGPRSRR